MKKQVCRWWRSGQHVASGRADAGGRARRLGWVGVVGGACGMLGGCTVDNAGPRRWDQGGFASGNASSGAGEERAFEPVRLRVHPLTHVDPGAADSPNGAGGDTVLVLHYELRDQFTDPVKGLGVLRVEAMRRAGGGDANARSDMTGAGSGGSGGERMSWDVTDVMDPRINSQRFDPATRTYRVALAGGPGGAWMNSPALIIRVTLTTPRGDGTRRVLEDEFVIER